MLNTLRFPIILLALTAACSSSGGKLPQDFDSDPDYTRGRTGAGGYAGDAGIQVDAMASPDAEAPAKVETGLDSLAAPDRVSDVEASAPDRQPDVVRQGPETQESQDTRKPDATVQQDSLLPADMQPDLLSAADLRTAVDVTRGSDAIAECTCPDPTRAACMVCYQGNSYNALGVLVGPLDGDCEQSGPRFSVRDWGCSICNPMYGKPGAGGLPCPTSMPYCNEKTGECSAKPWK